MSKENWVELEDLLGSFMAKFSYNGYKKNVEKIKNLILHLREDDYDLAVQNEYLQSERREYRQSLLRYKKLYEEAPVAYITMDLTGVIRDVNHKTVNILGLEREQIIGTSFSRFISPSSMIRPCNNLRGTTCLSRFAPSLIQVWDRWHR